MFGEGDGAGDEQVCVFEQDDELVALGGFGLVFGADGGDGLPSLLDGAADAVLVVLCEAMPEGWCLAEAGGRRLGFVGSHPFAQRLAKGWGTQLFGWGRGVFLAGGELGDGAEEGGQLVVAGGNGCAGGAIGVQGPQKQRERGCPGASGEQQKRAVEGHMPVGGWRADAADEDDLDEQAGGGKRLAEDGEVAPQEAKEGCRGESPIEIRARQREPRKRPAAPPSESVARLDMRER